MRIIHFVLLGTLLLSGLASCKQTDIDASNKTATLLANQADIKTYTSTPAFQAYIVSQGMSATTTSSGLYFATTQPNSATTVDNYGKEVEFNYTLYVLNGPSNGSTTVTSGTTSGTTTSPVAITAVKVDSAFVTASAFFPLFEGSLKAGLEEGLRRMHEGEKAILIMPSVLGYGGVVNNNVPANSPIRFDVTLKRARTEDQQINEYLVASKLTPTKVTSSGLRFIKTLSVASGDTIKATSTVTLNYVAKQLRAQTAIGFDSTKAGVDPYGLVGFKEGLVGMKAGEKATFIFPSSIGFGTKGLVNTGTGLYIVAPNTPLRFDVEVIKINP